MIRGGSIWSPRHCPPVGDDPGNAADRKNRENRMAYDFPMNDPSKIEITKAVRDDAPSVVEIFNRARAEMTYLPILHTAAETTDFITSLVRRGGVWVAKIGGKAVAFMEIQDGWLNHLYVSPDCQNRGIGKRMLDEAKRQRPEGLSLMVFEENTNAIRFYEREGFLLVEKTNQEQSTNEEQLADRKYRWKTTL